MIEEHLESLKKDYIKNSPPISQTGWQELRGKLDSQKQSSPRSIPRSLAAVVLAAFVFGGLVASAQAAKPGQPLYPVKIISENVYAQATGDQEFKIERRAQEVIETSDNGKSFDEASKQYQQAIDDAKDEAKDAKEDEKEQLRKKLEEQEERFQEAQNQKPKNKVRLEEILQRTRRTRGEVKGQKVKSLFEKEHEDHEEDKDKHSKDRY